MSRFGWGEQAAASIASPALSRDLRRRFDRPPELFALFEPRIGARSIQYTSGAEARRRRAEIDRAFGPRVVLRHLLRVADGADVDGAQRVAPVYGLVTPPRERRLVRFGPRGA